MKIIIVESPKKAKTIKKFLKNRRILVISSKGHIVDLPKNKFGIYIEEGGKLKVEYVLLKSFFLNYLRKLKNNINEFILA
ncbi:MAG: toprim domain-containing protein, partial [Nitrososphaerota archaeon]